MERVGPYAAKGKSKLGPFPPQQLPEPLHNDGKLGTSKAFVTGRVDPPRTRDFSNQQRDPKAFLNTLSGKPGFDVYANKGIAADYVKNSFEVAAANPGNGAGVYGPESLTYNFRYDPFLP